MERSIASLVFKGSVTQAVMESKRKKKLFVVYISGEDDVSGRLENTTWIDKKVAELVSKYCVMLHLLQGSNEAVQFSAIYIPTSNFPDPQPSAPCITVIGYNSVQIWQNEGFVTAETLQSTIDKAWLSLHPQESTASILTAALASMKYEPSSSETPTDGNQEDIGIPKVKPTTNTVVVNQELENQSRVRETSISVDIKQSDGRANIPLSPPLEPVQEEYSRAGGAKTPLRLEEKVISTVPEKNVARNHSAAACDEPSSIVSCGFSEPSQAGDAKKERLKKASVPKSDDVNLNIRLPNGTSLQRKFHETSTLHEVKAYVSENEAISINSYDLAIPYPRRVFSDQDLRLSLLELGLSNRQALIVVPHQQATGEPRVVNIARGQTNATADSSNANNEGYFSYLRRALSYFNPFSYIGGAPSSSSSETRSEASRWQYGGNPGLQANLRGSGSPYAQVQNKPESSNSNSNNNSNNKQLTSRPFGSNIHTLKRDEDGGVDKRNPFWNGNSTEYNGNGDNEDDK